MIINKTKRVFIILSIGICNLSVCQISEKVILQNGKILQLNVDGTFNELNNNTISLKNTHHQLVKWLKGKSIAEVREMLKIDPWNSNNYSTILTQNRTFHYPYGVSKSRAKGSFLFYRDFSQILWNPVFKRYENFYVYFYRGKFFSIVTSP